MSTKSGVNIVELTLNERFEYQLNFKQTAFGSPWILGTVKSRTIVSVIKSMFTELEICNNDSVWVGYIDNTGRVIAISEIFLPVTQFSDEEYCKEILRTALLIPNTKYISVFQSYLESEKLEISDEDKGMFEYCTKAFRNLGFEMYKCGTFNNNGYLIK